MKVTGAQPRAPMARTHLCVRVDRPVMHNPLPGENCDKDTGAALPREAEDASFVAGDSAHCLRSRGLCGRDQWARREGGLSCGPSAKPRMIRGNELARCARATLSDHTRSEAHFATDLEAPTHIRRRAA
jgi:hypothetical protein